MKKEEFFEILGELDDNMLKEAAEPIKRPSKFHSRKIWAAAACLALVCAACFSLIRFFPEDQPDSLKDGIAEQSTADIAPMVYVNDTLYIQSSDQKVYSEWCDDFLYLGTIESAITSESQPTQNFQSNDPIVGCEVYQYGENLVVRIQDTYRLYIKYIKTEPDWDTLSEQEKMQLDPSYMGQ